MNSEPISHRDVTRIACSLGITANRVIGLLDEEAEREHLPFDQMSRRKADQVAQSYRERYRRDDYQWTLSF